MQTEDLPSTDRSQPVWPAPATVPVIPPSRDPKTGVATTLGVVGLLIGGAVFAVVSVIAALSVSYCSTNSVSASDLMGARGWMSIATLFWIAGPAWAGSRYRRVDRPAGVWWTFVGIAGVIGLGSIILLEPWSLCLM